MMTMMCISFTSCDEEEDKDISTGIIGSWYELAEDESSSLTITFRSDKTGSMLFMSEENSLSQNFEYEYDTENSKLFIIGSLLNGSYDIRLTATKLILSDDDTYSEFSRI